MSCSCRCRCRCRRLLHLCGHRLSCSSWNPIEVTVATGGSAIRALLPMLMPARAERYRPARGLRQTIVKQIVQRCRSELCQPCASCHWWVPTASRHALTCKSVCCWVRRGLVRMYAIMRTSPCCQQFQSAPPCPFSICAWTHRRHPDVAQSSRHHRRHLHLRHPAAMPSSAATVDAGTTAVSTPL